MRRSSSARYSAEFHEVHMPLMQLVKMHLQRFPALDGLIHVPNEAVHKLAPKSVGILIGMGMRTGVSDLLLLRARRGYVGLAIELKAPGKLPKAPKAEIEQKAFLRQCAGEGWLACFCDDPAAAWRLLEWYLSGATAASSRDVLPQAALASPHFLWYHAGC